MKFLGAPYPIKKSSLGLMPTQFGLNQIKSDLLILLLTNPGERVMLPDFGTPLKQLLFEQNDEILAEQTREAIINSISKWEPRVTVKEINITILTEENSLYINILFYDYEEIQEIQELKLKIPLGNTREINEQLSL